MRVASRPRRTAWVIVAVVAALAFVSAAAAGCGDSPYKAAAKGMVRDLGKTRTAAMAIVDDPAISSGDTLEEQVAAGASMQQAIDQLADAVGQAESRLRALTPPDAAAQAFQSGYLQALLKYSEGLDTMSALVGYSVAAFTALEGPLSDQDQSGTWSAIGELTQTGVTMEQAAQAAALFRAAGTTLRDSSSQWAAITPPEGMQTYHQTISKALADLAQTFATMADLAGSAAATGSQAKLSDLTLQWELATDQWETLLEGLDSWSGASGGIFDDTSAALDATQKTLDHLEKTLSAL